MSNRKLEMYSFLSNEQYDLLANYLRTRFERITSDEKLSVVFDLLHRCNLNCVGCGTDAKTINGFDPALSEMTTEEVFLILDKLKDYEMCCGKRVFVNFGGGEPFLRPDIIDIVRYASRLFGCDGVGIDTNAALQESYTLISEASLYLSYIGISINGLKEYHNWWANKPGVDAYERSMATVSKLCSKEDISSKIEVTSVATKNNLNDIPQLMRILADTGVQNYSVHRVVPVGRMEKHNLNLVPCWQEYLILLVAMIETMQETGIHAHLHHSIESIHASLMCNIDTVSKEQQFEKNHRSSIGIDCFGNILVTPWCVGDLWTSLLVGNCCSDNRSVQEIIDDKEQLLELMRTAFTEEYRCHGCEIHCSGGSRIVAAATWMKENLASGTVEELSNALRACDPACPIMEHRKNETI